MPRKGYKCITVPAKVHEAIKKRAKETNRTIHEYIEYLLQREQPAKEVK